MSAPVTPADAAAALLLRTTRVAHGGVARPAFAGVTGAEASCS